MAQEVKESQLNPEEVTLLAEFRNMEPARSATVAPPASLTDRVADNIASAIGSWRFLAWQSAFFAAWIVLNLVGWRAAWDPYPFILLNLVLSFQAAYTAPIIMMSQNRQAAVDRHRALTEYQINAQAALEIKLIHQKLDQLRDTQVEEVKLLLKDIERRLTPADLEGVPTEAHTRRS